MTIKSTLLTSAALLAVVSAAQATSFDATPLSQGYGIVGDEKPAEGKCGEGKCGGDKAAAAPADGTATDAKAAEGKCGGDKAAEGDGKAAEGKCGEGKCGGDKAAGKEGSCGGMI